MIQQADLLTENADEVTSLAVGPPLGNGSSAPTAETLRPAWEMSLGDWRETCLGLLDRYNATPDSATWENIVRLGGVNCRFTSFAHKCAVQKALREGKPVPDNVLTDYPGLRK